MTDYLSDSVWRIPIVEGKIAVPASDLGDYLVGEAERLIEG